MASSPNWRRGLSDSQETKTNRQPRVLDYENPIVAAAERSADRKLHQIPLAAKVALFVLGSCMAGLCLGGGGTWHAVHPAHMARRRVLHDISHLAGKGIVGGQSTDAF